MSTHTPTKKTITRRIAIMAGIVCMISTMMACIEQRESSQDLSAGVASVTEGVTPLPSQKEDSTDTTTLSPTGKPTKALTPSPVAEPTKAPTPSPTEKPTETPTPTEEPAATPTKKPASGSSDEETSGSGHSNFNTHDNPEQQDTEDTWVLNTNTMKIHYPSCSSVKKIAPKNYSTSSESLDTLKSRGYTTCGICFK